MKWEHFWKYSQMPLSVTRPSKPFGIKLCLCQENILFMQEKNGQGIFTPMLVSINISNHIAKDILSFRRITIDCLRSPQTSKSSFNRKVSFQICWSGFNWWWSVSSRALWIKSYTCHRCNQQHQERQKFFLHFWNLFNFSKWFLSFYEYFMSKM